MHFSTRVLLGTENMQNSLLCPRQHWHSQFNIEFCWWSLKKQGANISALSSWSIISHGRCWKRHMDWCYRSWRRVLPGLLGAVKGGWAEGERNLRPDEQQAQKPGGGEECRSLRKLISRGIVEDNDWQASSAQLYKEPDMLGWDLRSVWMQKTEA